MSVFGSKPITYQRVNSTPSPFGKRASVAKKPTNAQLDKKYGKPSSGIGVGP